MYLQKEGIKLRTNVNETKKSNFETFLINL